jgi:hypothetical protein
VIACHCGDEADAERAMRPLREFGSPLADAIQRMPLPAMQKLLDDAFPDGTRNYGSPPSSVSWTIRSSTW